MKLDQFRARLPGCTVTELSAQVTDAGGTAIEMRLFTLAPDS